MGENIPLGLVAATDATKQVATAVTSCLNCILTMAVWMLNE